MKKITKRERFQSLLTIEAVKADAGLVEFIEHEIDLLAKKNASGEKKPTATQMANEGIKQAIIEGMEVNRLYTISEIIKEIPACADLSNQKVSAIVRQMVDVSVERIEEKRKAFFKVIPSAKVEED